MQRMKRVAFFAYGLACYVMFLGVFAYGVGFLGNVIVPSTVDSGQTSSLPAAVAINMLLLVAFGVQHSVMARPTFKRWWTRLVPVPIERSTYVLFTNLLLILLYWQWSPIPGVVWHVADPVARAGLYALFGLGWMLVFVATVQLNHLDLFGMRQVWLHLRGREYTKLKFQTPFLYRYVRHPLYVGWLTAFWATPTMTVGHLLFAGVMSAYILVAIFFEERNLIEAHGRAYLDYCRRVPMLIPSLRRGLPRERPPQTSPETA